MKEIDLKLPDSTLLYYPNFYSEEKSNILFQELIQKIKWKEDQIKIFGKLYWQPRLTAFYANNIKTYSYSSLKMKPLPFTSTLQKIKSDIEKLADLEFTSCLANLYRDGKDSNGWHADDEKELGKNPIIASLSLGAERNFKLRHKSNHQLNHKLLLEHGSLLLMKGETQHFWQHQIPKTQKKIDKRINLTFRIL
ncbi:alpha-ketoglutarate-dependent dioxygenase AlkB family protein [Mesonia aestuariivivens]|uniref:Alpha-ketoglutarate-dependent dioxygenase AlkB n=1 Tax=Mesonia aestuariivivens TaxID=2796128 RepID=A0ABS6VZT2_9FLAO|nr:alpha-ketoglutarate-dependent dioxygenase AlkB [Mesonia aestuariivivens]MBW2960812.1 alpha-ketoglutarate-dependent dioxygenase AlkB [Mesonia aestuariivivens]